MRFSGERTEVMEKRSGRERGGGLQEQGESALPDRADSSGRKAGEEYLLVDGYNIIFAWEELKELAEASIDGARTKADGHSLQLSGISEMYCDPGFRCLSGGRPCL